MRQSSNGSSGNFVRRFLNRLQTLASLMLLIGLSWVPTASAVDNPSTYPGCANISANVAWGGSVDVDMSSCHFFGLGVLFDAPEHGVASEGPEPVNYYTYSHNGSTPGGGGTDTFIVRDDNSDFITVTVTIAAPTSAITVSPASLGVMTAGTPYTETLTSSGGTAPYTYTLESGALPVGVTRSGDTLSGTPTERGPYSFSIRSTDNTGDFAVKGYSGSVDEPDLTLVPSSATAIQSVPFSLQLATTGGVAPHSYQLEVGGSFPAGISVSSTGLISGTTAAAPGNYPVTLRVTDSSTGPGAYFELEPFTLTVSPPPSVSIAVAPASVDEDDVASLVYTVTRSLNLSSATTVNIGTSGTAISGDDYTGGVATVDIPSGATTATITIDPSADATVEVDETVILTVAAGTGYTVGAPDSASGTIANDDVPVTVNPATLPNATVAAAYSQAITAADGTGPYTFAVTAGALPAGLTLASDGTLSGTPTAGGSFNFTVTATDATLATGSRAYTLAVNAPTIAVAPTTLPSGTVDAAYSETISGSGGTASYSYAVTAGALPGGLTLDSGTGELSGTPSTGGSFNFTVTATDSSTGTGPYAGSRAYTLTIDPILAGAPTAVTATAGDGQASVAFTAPASNGGSAITNYTVTSSPGAITATGAGSPIVVTGLTNGVAYTFTVTADNAAGTGPASAASNSVTPAAPQTITFANPGAQNFGTSPTLTASATSGLTVSFSSSTPGVCTITSGGALTFVSAGTCTIDADQAGDAAFLPATTVSRSFTVNAVPPGAPTIGTATAGDTQATITFVAPAFTGGSTITGYTVTASPGGATASGAGSPIVITGLTNGVAYTFTVTADNVAGTGPASAASNSVTPAATQTITFANPGAQNFGTTPTLTATSDSGLTPTFTSSTTGVCTITSGGALTFVSTGTCTINADQAGNGSYLPAPQVSRSFSVNPVVPGAPTAVTATAGNTSATVSFTAPAFTGGTAITGYTVTSSPGGITASGAGGPILVNGLTNGVAYTFTVTADNAAGTGPASLASNSVTPQAPVIVIDPATLADGTVGVAYSQALNSSGGVAPYTYSVSAGSLPSGMTLGSGGLLSGTPTAPGTYNFSLTSTDNNGDSSNQAFSLAVAAPAISLDPLTLADGTVGTAYSQAITASGGSGPYTYALASGAIPAGMSFTSAGSFNGTPTVAGSFNFTVEATDTFGSTGSQAYTFTVGSPTIALAPATLADGTAGAAYSQSVSATGGTAPYTYSLLSGALPAGMSFASDGTLSGTPSAVGSFNLTLRATDAFGSTGDQAYTFSVNAPALGLAPGTTTFNAGYDVPFSQAFSATGGTGPYSYALTGTLPTGLTFAGDTLSGTATEPGSYAFTVTSTDSSTGTGAPFSVAVNYTLEVTAPIVTITPATLPAGTANSAYTALLTASGGSAPYAFWIVDPANFPAGMTFDGGGNVGGTPTTAGSYTFTVEVADQYAQGTQQTYTLVIAVESPTAGNVSATVAYNSSANVIAPVLGGGTATSVAIAGAAANGTATATGTSLSYTPNPGFAGVDTFTYTATNASGTSAAATVTVTVSDPTLAIADGGPANGTAGTAFSRTFSFSGGAAPYTMAVTGLPAGLSVTNNTADTVTVSGTPTVAGSFTLTVSGDDSSTGNGPFSISQTFPLTIAAPTLTLTPGTLANGVVGAAYTASFSTSGGTAPYGYAVTAGTLPAGLSLAAGGTLSGTPTTPGTNSFTVTTTDALGFTASQAYTLTVDANAPTAAADSASTLSDQAVLIAVTANDTGDITGIAIVDAPSDGTAVVSGLDVNYTPNAGFSGTDTFTYTATGPGGTSAPALVTVTVNPVPVAPDFSVTTTPETPVQVTLTAGASGGPFTGADVVAVTPAAAGTTSIAASGADFVLTFTPAAGFAGSVVVSYTLDNAFATSAEGLVNILVEDRPDPSQDAEVQGVVDAQAESAKRFASGQINNFQRRLENLHRGGDGGFENGIGFAIDRPCIEPLIGRNVDPCGDRSMTGAGNQGLTATDDPGRRQSGDGRSPLGIWTGGTIRSGSQDGRDGGADISFETDGLSTGVDYRVNDALVVGGGFGYGRDDNEVGRNGSRVDGSARTLALYGSYHPGESFFLDTVLGYQQLDFDLRRYVTATDGLVSGQRDGDQWFASVSIGADIQRETWMYTPYARFDLSRATLDAYTETGDPIYALRYEAMDVDNSTATLGLRLNHQMPMEWGRFTPQLRVEYQRDLGGRSDAVVRYADLLGGPRYGLLATDFDRNRFLLGLGMLFDLDSGWGWRLEYSGQVGSSDSSDHGVSVNVQKQF
jgi:outer membrane autotransporter protein